MKSTTVAGLNPRTMHLRLLAAVIGVSGVFFILFGAAAVNRIAALTRSQVHGEALGLVAVRAEEIKGFFCERGRVADTVLANPALLEWFGAYDEYRRPLDDDAGYASVLALFASVVDRDPVISSIFFATDRTAEYFHPGGRVEREDYDPTTRWWWQEALAMDCLYVSPPGVDAGTGQVSVTVQRTVYTADGSFLGVGGIDVLLGTLGALVEDITYHGVGDAFLVDSSGNLIYFPGLLLIPDRPGAAFSTRLGEVDELADDSGGFGELEQLMQEPLPGLHRVRWQGQERIVVHTPVRAESPRLDWTLGLMVPEELISAVIFRAKLWAALGVLLGVSLIAGITLYLTNRVNRRLREESRRRAEILTEANARLSEADHMKSQFLATMSHELRTPLNSIIGFSEILRSRLAGEIDPTFERFLTNIHASGEHLLSMISDILDLSKVEAGKMELHREPVVMAELVESVTNIVQGSARQRQVVLRTEIADQLPQVYADPVRVKQILFNLLSNAVKFSLEGAAVTVGVRYLDPAQSPLGEPAVELAVTDEGIGIAPEDHELIFEQFRQVDDGGGRRHGGTGLGLTLVKRLVELHEGTVSVDSSRGRGSVFRVVLPLGAPCDPGLADTDQPARPPARTILVVEDDDFAAEQIIVLLEEAGYRAVRCRDGHGVVELALRLRPTAVVLDIVLPDTDGWDVLRALKNRRETTRIPVIIVSVLANHELGMALGADAYFTKPVNGPELLARLRELVPDPTLGEPWILVIDDDPQLHDMLGEVLRGGGYQVGHAFSGIDGLSLARTRQPHLILLDLMMEGMDGFEVAAELQREPLTRGIPVIVLTALDTSPEERRRLQGKIASLVEKTQTSAPALLPVIDELLGRRQREPGQDEGA